MRTKMGRRSRSSRTRRSKPKGCNDHLCVVRGIGQLCGPAGLACAERHQGTTDNTLLRTTLNFAPHGCHIER